MKSIGNKLIVYFSVLLLVVCSIMGWFAQYEVEGTVIDEVQKTLPQTAQEASNLIHTYVDRQYVFLEGVASRDRISNSQNNIQDKISILNEAAKKEGYLRMGVADLQGNLYLTDTYGINGQVVDVSSREYYKVALQGKRGVMEPTVSINPDDHGGLVMVYAVPIYDHGVMTGVLVAIGDGNFLSNITNNITFGETGYAYMINKNTKLIAHKDKNLVIEGIRILERAQKDKEWESIAEQSQNMINEKIGFGEYEFKGEELYAGFSHIENTDWIVVITVQKSEMLSMLPDMKKKVILVTVLILLIGIGVAYFIGKTISKPIVGIKHYAEKIADLDVREDVDEKYTKRKDEIGILANSFQLVTHNLRKFIEHIQSSSEQVASSSEELKATSEQSALASEHVATSSTEVASHTGKQLNEVLNATSAMQQISASIEEISATSQEVNQLSTTVYEKSNIGKQEISGVILQMNHIGNSTNEVQNALVQITQSSKKIDNIINLIQDISQQTNLLALNAAIEAARAGDAGKGFAVVAEEVRKLAEETQRATEDINDLIEENGNNILYADQKMNEGLKEVDKGIQAVKGTEKTFGEISYLVDQVNNQIETMTESIRQVAEGSQDIVYSTTQIEETSKEVASQIQNVSAAAEEQTASMEEIASASESLSELSMELQELVKKFKI
ncbi:methyl-accepting chemotaxis protein [Inediibacterium massiliense]|uniref:methyl-accepting chemotaxis protein n=1 Tax=Inediibacterium massiliense TaxID=1658111 RepID=UPI0006B58BCE|nr:methyl-accepting chemotaxis protein [Inediibacterium massiliense]